MFGNRSTVPAMIPAEMLPEHRAALSKAGVRFGELDEEDRRFVHVMLPRGWRYVTTATSGGWSSVLDAQGRKRAITHCCTDRPYMTLALRRYTYDSDRYPGDATTAFKVLDITEQNKVLFITRRHADQEQAREEAKAWLNKHYPRWEDASAYWR